MRPEDKRLRARCQAPLALIRPDQHVAWRGQVPGEPAVLLDVVRSVIPHPAAERSQGRQLQRDRA